MRRMSESHKAGEGHQVEILLNMQFYHQHGITVTQVFINDKRGSGGQTFFEVWKLH